MSAEDVALLCVAGSLLLTLIFALNRQRELKRVREQRDEAWSWAWYWQKRARDADECGDCEHYGPCYCDEVINE